MSTALLYHGWDVAGYTPRHADYRGEGLVFTIEPQAEQLCCSHCGSRRVRGEGKGSRRFRTLPIGSKPVSLALAVPRLGCHDCGATRQMPLSFADPRRNYTHSFERYVLELSQNMTI